MRYILSAVALLAFYFSDAQLYMPRDIKAAYDKGTRSTDGRLGKNYWQNHAVYDINVTALPPDRNIEGKETITYYNESPDTLKGINFKILLNIHKAGAPRDGSAGADYLTDGVHIDAATENGKKISVPADNTFFTNLGLRVPDAVLPHQSVQFSFEWHYTISKQSGREGMIDSTTYFLAYFYPRVAVRDDYNGWDKMNFVDSHEFYSDFNDYTVTLNVPKNYIVTGTGALQTPENLLQASFLQKYRSAMSSDQTVNIVTAADLQAKNITVQHDVNSWQFKATDIPDMAYGISDHFVWDGCSTVVDDATGRRAGAYAMYNNTAADYHHVAQYARHSLEWFSHNWPGVPYPYEKTTVFQGFAGMEYPMMANDETYADTIFSRFVAEHEIAHTYMPFYMGINETRYGFMDEGWATTFENLIGNVDMGKEKATKSYQNFRVTNWINDLSAEEEIPIITPGDALSGRGLGNNEYGKASLGYLAMKDLLGDAEFKKCLLAYMDRWHSKHPIPWDFFYTFDNVSGKNLDWFWKAWFFDNSYIDLALKSAVKTGNGYTVTMNNPGGMPAPVDLLVTYTDGSTETFHETPAVWEKDIRTAVFTIPAKKAIRSIKTSGGIFMDADEKNNHLDL
jgi:hypothetical protein